MRGEEETTEGEAMTDDERAKAWIDSGEDHCRQAREIGALLRERDEARSDVPALCAEVRRLRLQVRALENAMKEGDEAEKANPTPSLATAMELRALAAETRAERAEARASKLHEAWLIAIDRNCELEGRAEKAEARVGELEGKETPHDP